MEFVIATFPTSRGVRMDGAPQGRTGQLIGVQRGHHVFDLGNPKDYVPASVPAVVLGTSQAQPMVIEFQPASAVAAGVPPVRGLPADMEGGIAAAPPPETPRAARAQAVHEPDRQAASGIRPKAAAAKKAKKAKRAKMKPERANGPKKGTSARGAKNRAQKTTASKRKPAKTAASKTRTRTSTRRKTTRARRSDSKKARRG